MGHQFFGELMRKSVIYARYSTDLQNEKSIADQISLCRKYATNERLQVAKTYEDRAISGASINGRSGLIALLADAAKKQFDVLIVESLDRLSRDISDLGYIHKTFSFMGIDIIGVNDGGRPADTIMIGLRGLVGQLFREDGAKKVRRGMIGLVNAGKHTGGRAYGYAPSPLERGNPQIVAAEAVTVRRIFDEYLSGKSPREIAHGLNEDGIAPPRGMAWNASTINGSPQRGNGIIQNEQYAGVLVWNKVRMCKNPVTGKRVSRPNPPSTWLRHEVSHLAIVDRETFEAANALKSERGKHRLETAVRKKRLLSHLLKCGCCGGGLSTAGVDKTGRVRVRCSTHAESGTCAHPKTYYLPWIENTVLSALGKELKDRSTIDAAYASYRDDHLNQIEKNNQRKLEILTRLEQIPIEISRLTYPSAGARLARQVSDRS